MPDLNKTINEIFPDKTVVVIGDLVADQFLNGTISRVSREAPVFILRHQATHTLPGAAANTAVNVASIGGKAVLIGITGTDENAETLLKSLSETGVDCSGIIRDEQFATTTKVRILAGQHYAARQQVIRIDYENSEVVSTDTKEQLRQKLSEAARAADAIILSDYNYGAVFAEIIADALLISRTRQIPLIVDSRYSLESFAGATTATPNREEIEQILGGDFTDHDCMGLRERLGCEALLITNGNAGMKLFEAGRPMILLDAVGAKEPVDVTGAGDTVIAVYALGLASGLAFSDAANVANHAGGLVVMKKGTASVTVSELLSSLNADQSPLAAKSAD